MSGNVVVTPEGVAKVLDFGLSRTARGALPAIGGLVTARRRR
jgi:hypothetical protein